MDRSESFERIAGGILMLSVMAGIVWLIAMGTASFRNEARQKDERTELLKRAVVVLEKLEAREAAKGND